jgi:histidinol-phosphatase (PHP family)
MIGLVDYHMHTVLSDGKDSYEEMIKVAIEKGLAEIGFTDHVCLKPVDWAINLVDIPVMTAQITDLQEKYKSRIHIRYGIEGIISPDMNLKLRILLRPSVGLCDWVGPFYWRLEF